MKSVLVIGAGQFGHHLAFQLCDMGNDVMLVDKNEKLIEEFSHRVTSCEIGDYTVRNNLEALGIEDYDYVFVCVGDFKDSLIIVDTLEELHAKRIIAKASSLIHEKILLKNGADETIYPERDCAHSMAVSYSYSSVFDFIDLDDNTGIFEISVPDSWRNKSLAQINVRKNHGVNVVAYKSKGKVYPVTSPDYIFEPEHHLLVMGEKKAIRKLDK